MIFSMISKIAMHPFWISAELKISKAMQHYKQKILILLQK